jgi:hypothetical protein
MKKYYEVTENECDFISMIDMKKLYKNKIIGRKTTDEYRQMTLDRLKGMMKGNLFWKHVFNQNYVERYMKKGYDKTHVITNLRLKKYKGEE